MPSRLPFAEPYFSGPDFVLLPLADLADTMALRVNILTAVFTTTFPIAPMWFRAALLARSSREIPMQRKGGSLPNPPLCTLLVLALAGVLGALESSTLGLVLDFYLLAPDVLLDRLGVLHDVLAHAHLLLGHGALAHHDLFLGHRND